MNGQPDKQTAENGDDQRDEGGQFAEGNLGGPGRPRGAPNKVNAILKEDIAEAYRQRGGIEWLTSLKDRDFVRLLEKTMPREVAADITSRQDQEPLRFTFKIGELSDDELECLAHTTGLDTDIIKAGDLPAPAG